MSGTLKATFKTVWGGRDKLKPLITADCDGIVAEMNKQYSRLSSCFYFFNAGEDNRLTEMMEKEKLCSLAAKYGLNDVRPFIRYVMNHVI